MFWIWLFLCIGFFLATMVICFMAMRDKKKYPTEQEECIKKYQKPGLICGILFFVCMFGFALSPPKEYSPKVIEETNNQESINSAKSNSLQKEETDLKKPHDVTENYPKVKEIIEYLSNTYNFLNENSISLKIKEIEKANKYNIEIDLRCTIDEEFTRKQIIEAVLYIVDEIGSEFEPNVYVAYNSRVAYLENGKISHITARNDSNSIKITSLEWRENGKPFDPNDILSSEDSSEPSTVTEQEIPKEQSEVETKIISTTKAEFGEQNFIMVNYIPEDNYVLIKAKGKENLSNEATVKGMYLSISKILKELKDIPDLNIDFNIEYSMIDTSGNLSSMIVIKATYTNATRSNINWDRFLWENTDIIADEWWIHPALQEAWQK